MKAKVLLIAAALLMFAAVSFGQGGVNPFTFVTLTYPVTPQIGDCSGPAARLPLPDGTPVYLFLDPNSTGPDPSDPLAPLCNNPPECADGPALTWNINQFAINSDVSGAAGTFYCENYLSIIAANLLPNRLFLRVYYPNRAEWTTMYTSPIFANGADGANVEYEVTTWVCQDTVRTPPVLCTQTAMISFVPVLNPGPQTPVQFKCIEVCEGGSTVISVGPVANSPLHPRLPNIVITPGCNPCPGEDLCTLDNPGAVNPMAIPAIPPLWTFVQNGGLWFVQTTVLGVANGCVCVTFDFLLPVEMGNVTVTPLDNKAEMVWNTRSESSLARFEVVRDGEVIGVETARNHTSDESYLFVDETAENGHIYTYELAVVGLDGSRDVVFSGKVAPNAMYAKPTEYALGQNFPNPFNPTTTISFDIVDTNPVTLMVYNANGQLVTTLLNNVSKDAGRYSMNFDASNLTSGLYFYTVKVGNVYTATKKMLLVK